MLTNAPILIASAVAEISFTAGPGISPQAHVEAFVFTLFEPGEAIELRLIESWTESARRMSRLVSRYWLTANELLDNLPLLQRENREQAANVYFGVAPRSTKGGTKEAIQKVNCIWADLDDISADDAAKKWERILPQPTIVVVSGTGIHVYWRLAEPLPVSSDQSRAEFEAMLQALYRELGSDTVQDVSRILRLPGFPNVKEARNGARPLPCTMLVCDSERRYPYSIFDRWRHRRGEGTQDANEHPHDLANGELRSQRTERRIRGLIRYLDHPVDDRSRRDFAVVCGLLRAGLPLNEVRVLVESCSKFAGNKRYLETTLQNAQEAVFGGD
jgi:hypothetical protein